MPMQQQQSTAAGARGRPYLGSGMQPRNPSMDQSNRGGYSLEHSGPHPTYSGNTPTASGANPKAGFRMMGGARNVSPARPGGPNFGSAIRQVSPTASVVSHQSTQ